MSETQSPLKAPSEPPPEPPAATMTKIEQPHEAPTYMNMMASDIPYHGSSQGIASAAVSNSTSNNNPTQAFQQQINAWFHKPQEQIDQDKHRNQQTLIREHMPYINRDEVAAQKAAQEAAAQQNQAQQQHVAVGMTVADADIVAKKLQAQQDELIKQQRILQQQIDQLQKLQDQSSTGTSVNGHGGVSSTTAALSVALDEYEGSAPSPGGASNMQHHQQQPRMAPPPDISVCLPAGPTRPGGALADGGLIDEVQLN